MPSRLLLPAPLLLLFLAATPAAAHEPVDASLARATSELERRGESVERLLRRAELRLVRGDHDAAARDLARASALDPADARVDLYRGRLRLEQGDPAAAAVALARYLARVPHDAIGRTLRARALARLDRPLASAAEYSAALAEGPRTQLYYERAQVLAAAGPGHVAQALAGLDEARAGLGTIPSLELYAIDLELERGAWDEALARLARVAALAQSQGPWLARRGEILELAGRDAEARAAYAEARKAFATLPAARRGTRASARLEAQVASGLARLDGGSAP